LNATGLADPGPTLQTMLVDPYLARTLKMDGVVTVVDAANGPATLDAQFEAVSQVTMADLIVLSKTDLASSEDLNQIRGRPDVHKPRCAGSGCDQRERRDQSVLGLTGLRQESAPADILAWTTGPDAPSDPLGESLGPGRCGLGGSGIGNLADRTG